MIVCLNKPQNSVCFVMERPEEIDDYLFIPEEMELVNMPPLPDGEDYAEYFVVGGRWVHYDYIDRSALSEDKPARVKEA